MADPALTAWWDPKTQKTLAARQGLGPTLGITRTTEKYRYNSAGILVAVAAGEAAFDHDPITKASLGLSIHESRINLALHSRDMSNVVHVATNITKGSTSVLDPTNTANVNVRLTASASNGTLLQTVTSASANRAFAAFIKRVTGSGNIQVTVDGGATWTTVTVTADWTRLDIAQATVTNPQFGVRIVTSGDAIDYWGPDLQTGLFITPHIPTVASSVTRNFDNVTTPDVTWLNQSAGTFYVRCSLSAPLAANQIILEASDGSPSDLIRFNCATTDGSLDARSATTVGDDGDIAGTKDFVANVESGAVLAYADNDMIVYLDGASGGTETTVTLPASETLSEFQVGATQSPSAFLNGHIAEIRYYNVRKDNQFLEDLSNGLISEAAGAMIPIMRRRRGR